MEILEIVMITLQLTAIFARRKHKKPDQHSSDESIENLLYFKDCKQKHTTPAPVEKLQRMVEPPKPPACPCPRMCCSMCCDCGVPEGPQSFISRQMAPLQMPSFEPSPSEMGMPPNMPPNMPSNMPPNMPPNPQAYRSHPPMGVQPQIVRKRKKLKMLRPNHMKQNRPPLMPQPTRRALGFTRENIKTLISKDQDIKKILKDLVRVTMNKVDLVGAVSSRRNLMMSTEAPEAEAITDPPTTDDEDVIEDF